MARSVCERDKKMIESLIKGLLGPSLAPLFDYITTHPSIVAIVLSILVAVYVAGRIQLHNISIKTQGYVLARYKEEIQRKPNITPESLYKLIYPEWTSLIKKWGLFIPHRLDLWPIPATPDNVKNRIDFNSKWIANVLENKQIK